MTAATPEIVILTGAGVSAESGLGTFRDVGGVWTQVRLEDVATPEAFARDPDRVLAFYDARRAASIAARPNAAHAALARLQTARPGLALIVTQNVDDLHERAGATQLLHMHGALLQAWCRGCDARSPWAAPMPRNARCPACREGGGLRPDIVWFGEMPYHMAEIDRALSRCALFVSIGTSGAVYPAAGFVAEARASGARTLELNLAPGEGARFFDDHRYGPATQIVPEWVDAVLDGGF